MTIYLTSADSIKGMGSGHKKNGCTVTPCSILDCIIGKLSLLGLVICHFMCSVGFVD